MFIVVREGSGEAVPECEGLSKAANWTALCAERELDKRGSAGKSDAVRLAGRRELPSFLTKRFSIRDEFNSSRMENRLLRGKVVTSL